MHLTLLFFTGGVCSGYLLRDDRLLYNSPQLTSLSGTEEEPSVSIFDELDSNWKTAESHFSKGRISPDNKERGLESAGWEEEDAEWSASK